MSRRVEGKEEKIDFAPLDFFYEFRDITNLVTTEEIQALFYRLCGNPTPPLGSYIVCISSLSSSWKKLLYSKAFSVIYLDKYGVWQVEGRWLSYVNAYISKQLVEETTECKDAFIVFSQFAFFVKTQHLTLDNFMVRNNTIIIKKMHLPPYAFYSGGCLE